MAETVSYCAVDDCRIITHIHDGGYIATKDRSLFRNEGLVTSLRYPYKQFQTCAWSLLLLRRLPDSRSIKFGAFAFSPASCFMDDETRLIIEERLEKAYLSIPVAFSIGSELACWRGLQYWTITASIKQTHSILDFCWIQTPGNQLAYFPAWAWTTDIGRL